MGQKMKKHGNWTFKINCVSFKINAILLLEEEGVLRFHRAGSMYNLGSPLNKNVSLVKIQN